MCSAFHHLCVGEERWRRLVNTLSVVSEEVFWLRFNVSLLALLLRLSTASSRHSGGGILLVVLPDLDGEVKGAVKYRFDSEPKTKLGLYNAEKGTSLSRLVLFCVCIVEELPSSQYYNIYMLKMYVREIY